MEMHSTSMSPRTQTEGTAAVNAGGQRVQFYLVTGSIILILPPDDLARLKADLLALMPLWTYGTLTVRLDLCTLIDGVTFTAEELDDARSSWG